MPEEPAENISGGDAGGGTAAEFVPAEADTRAEAVVDELGQMYWQKAYGGQDAFECLVRTILSQNTSDVASQPAHDSLMDRYAGGDGDSADGDSADGDLAAALADAEQSELAETIASAGLYNQKSEMIIGAAERICESFGGADGFDEFVKDEDPDTVRKRLLDIHGVGPKTADCVLLFSGGRGGVFPVDTHVHRIGRRMGLASADADHEDVREHLEADVPAEKCGFGHTAMIQFGREYCKARKPACLDGPEACPLYDLCDRVGVDEVEETVVDPAEAD
ncbi:endoiii-related endonuclease [Halogeometricum borinquense DSM 11551]|uniref:Endoiii-related endonuclease n=1 Tax=Halogeometricum borinquense (strain ATCC 700274 / DSM 11551 / JCM 10706 / KCTC 4070 / PR3) TaxID=469382 RepID=E4NQV6_HALBP|nr:endonuclease III [Halogeometricum borinquense]ADQ67903.1 predicted endoIII-related endonuclease [Halogeometricum borinquense DSM 11551]ELY24177.1 endoiii-related endonuclease [Halogeometricum borinquense DSM 11551]